MKNRWLLYKRTDDNLINHLCAIRGLDPKELTPDFLKHIHDPAMLPDIDKAVDLIERARKDNWFITVFGDYDADGTPAAALLSIVFDRLNIGHEVVLPTRKTGYGLNLEVVKKAAKTSKLLITVDTGISSVDEISLAKKLGLKTIVIDHHLPKDSIPEADALIDPFLPNSKYPFNDLCGCALAYKLTVALSRKFPDELTEGFCKWLLDLVAISTVSDMMPLINENRALVHYGLQVLSKTKKVGLVELMKVAGISPNTLSSYSLGFAIGPRLNASGRLSDNRPAFDLLKETDSKKAAELAEQINQANFERQKLVKDLTEQIDRDIWNQNDRDDRVIVVTGSNWPSGILGLAAGKIASQTNRPAVVLSKSKDELSGSGRSLDYYSLIGGLEHSSKHLARFGGHKLAAGLATDEASLPKFVDTIKAHARENISKEDLVPKITIDAALEDSEISDDTVKKINAMAPFGFGNPSPLLLIKNVELLSPRSIGAKSDHLKAKGKIKNRNIDVIGFGLAKDYFENPYEKVDMVGSLEHNLWQGNRSLQLKIKDFRPNNSAIDEELTLP